MTQQGNIYTADNGKMIVRKEDNFVMGESIDLGSDDNINNYTEKAFTEEEIARMRADVKAKQAYMARLYGISKTINL